MLACPACQGPLEVNGAIACPACPKEYPEEAGIPLLYAPHDAPSYTENVRSFYEEHPFPNYEEFDSADSLRQKARQGIFARLLDEQIPRGAFVIECGCGTGQLSNFLGMNPGRTVFGTDICLNSLKLGHGFKTRNRIPNVTFLQQNLFRPVFKPETFDLVISNGVLLVTSDPFRGFQSIARLVKPGGYILIGLYNTFGRLSTDLRRWIFRLTGDRFQFLDPRLRDKTVGAVRKKAWFMDQYKNPYETKQSYGEVLGWFQKTGIEFINSIPKAGPFQAFSQHERLFERSSMGTRFDRFRVQTGMMLSGGAEGGFFVMIGRKPA
jgi:SAM-dependent methyltransferase